MVQRTQAGGISQMGRATQGVRVMNMRDDDRVSAVALVVESGAAVEEDGASEDGGRAPRRRGGRRAGAEGAEGRRQAGAQAAPRRGRGHADHGRALGIVSAAVDELRGRNALVTGAGGGLGGYIARALAAEGVNLALTDLPAAPVDELVDGAAGPRRRASRRCRPT